MLIETTDNHPFWVEGRGWIFADELKAGDKLQKADGSNLTIDRVEFVLLDEPVMVYNFTVEEYHTYYVTDLGIWVHNTNCPMIGANGVQVTSKTLFTTTIKKQQIRLDVENPSPGKRAGQVHVQNDATGEKWYYNFDGGYFYDRATGNKAPNYINDLMKDKSFTKKLNEATTKYLGM